MAELRLAAADAANAGAFLARLVRFDPAAVVRLRPAAGGRTAMWGRLPWEPLVTRVLAITVDDDVTFRAAELLDNLTAGGGSGEVDVRLPARRDAEWRWSLPPEAGRRVVETLPAARVRELAAAAQRAIREAVARAPVGERAVRDAFLDHVAVVVREDVSNSTGPAIEVPQRLVQALVRMGFVRPAGGPGESDVGVLIAGKFVGLAAEFGVSWYRTGAGPNDRLIV